MLRAQSDVDSNFVGALIDAIRHHSVDAHSGERHRQRGKAPQQQQSKRCTPPDRQQIVHGLNAAHSNLAIRLQTCFFTSSTRRASGGGVRITRVINFRQASSF